MDDEDISVKVEALRVLYLFDKNRSLRLLKTLSKNKDPNIRMKAVLTLGEIATAVIQVKSGQRLTAEEVNEYCRELARFKRPRRIIFEDVPRNPTGKIEKPKLRKKYSGTTESFKI